MFISYKPGVGASRLARALQARIVYPLLSKQVARKRRVYSPTINWGCSAQQAEGVLNRGIQQAQSKPRAFETLAALNLPVPRWHNDYTTLFNRISGRSILARRDRLSAGRGIVLLSRDPGTGPRSDVAPADFFVERLSYRREFRIHVWQGQPIHIQGKVRTANAVEGAVARNYETGYLYTSQGLDRYATGALLRDCEQLAVRATEALGLDFAAVDLLETKHGKLYFLEANTAPALRSDATFGAYLGAIKQLWRLP